MKRSDAIKLVANQLDFIKGTFAGYKEDFSKQELGNADVILTTLESAGMMPPFICKGDICCRYEWEYEDETK